MKKNEVTIGNTYAAKVTDKVVPVRLDAEHANGGWYATNLVTGKRITVKSAQRLRCPCDEHGKRTGQLEATNPKTEKARQEAIAEIEGRIQGEPKPRPNATAEKKLSLLAAAATVLANAEEPMACKAIVEGAMALGWTTSGKTPHATLYSAMTREINTKGDASRFIKVDRGRFALKSA